MNYDALVQQVVAAGALAGDVEAVRGLRGRDLLTVTDLSAAEARGLLVTAVALKSELAQAHGLLAGRVGILLFEKPSLRTRISFEVGLARLGGTAIYMDHSGQRLGQRESVHDYGKNLERWVDCIIARVFHQSTVEGLAHAARVPVINGLSERFHPCQALADYQTLMERWGGTPAALRGRRVAYIGDGNNVCHSLMELGAMLGVHVTAITPEGREPAGDVMERVKKLAAASGAEVRLSHDPAAVRGHDAVYTDVWVSMGDASVGDPRARFGAYRVTPALMAKASEGTRGEAVFMHCLPAHRGEEVAEEVIDSGASVVFDQAENRMHAQNALLAALLAR